MELLQVIGRLLTDKCPIVRLNIICTIDKANKVGLLCWGWDDLLFIYLLP